MHQQPVCSNFSPAVAVTAWLVGPLSLAVGSSLGVGETAAGVIGGAVAGAVGDAVGQGVGLAIGAESKFNWSEVAESAISGGVSGGIGASGAFSGISSDFARGFVTGVASNAVTQGIEIATGLQHSFDWAGVATAGVTQGVATSLSAALPGAAQYNANGSLKSAATTGNVFTSGMAGAIAGATARSLLSGTDFGDNLISALPSAIGATIGNALAGQAQDSDGASTGDPIKDALRAGFDRAQASEDGLAGYARFAGPGAAAPKNDEGFLGHLWDEITSGAHWLLNEGEALVNDVSEAVGAGDVFDIDSGSIETVVVTANRIPIQSDSEHVLGNLSMIYETGYTPGHEARAAAKVSSGINDPGGVSYGAYQLNSSRRGGQQVLAFLRNEGKPWASRFSGLDPTIRGGAFGDTWKAVAAENPTDFFNAQHSYIERTHYDPVVNKVLDATGLDINSQSDAVQDVVWSMSVQHGRAAMLVTQAVDNLQGQINPSDPQYQSALINQLYDVREQYVTQNHQSYLITTRYEGERVDALMMLGQ